MELQRFSTSGEYLAVCGVDGRLRIWETGTGVLKQEFVPSSHLSATITCLDWAPSKSQIGKKKKRRHILEGEIVALGTAVGSLLFYSVAKAQLIAHTAEAHRGQVTGVSWNPATLALYSCGSDGFVVEWNPVTATVVSRWKAGKSELSSMCVFNDNLLVGGNKITLWSLETKTSIMNYGGHASSINQIIAVQGSEYFLTMSMSDRHLRIWSRSERNAVVTLVLPDHPQNCYIYPPSDSNVYVAVTTKAGELLLFQHKLNGPLRQPLMPISCLNIVESSNDKKSVAVLATYIYEEPTPSVLICYGNSFRVKFEQFDVKYLQDNAKIKRDFTVNKSKLDRKSKDLTKEKAVEIPNDVKHLQPGSEKLSNQTTGKGKKRKKEGEEIQLDNEELPMEERLSNLTIDVPATGTIPDGSNLAHLLSQGLHSKDVRILQSVLSRWDDEVISSTVRSLPVQLVVPLLKEIRSLLNGKAMLNHSAVKWLKIIFQIHAAFIMSCPSTEELLAPFMSLLRTREVLYPQMCQLKGKLELIKGNIQAKEHKSEEPNQALLVYHDESSDEELGDDDDLIPSESEEFIESDELGVDDDESSGEDSDASGSDSEDDSSQSINEDSDDQSKSKKSKATEKKAGPTLNKGETLAVINGTDDESMDDDE